MNIPSLPKTNYVIDGNGQKLSVQIALKDWEHFIEEFERLETLLAFKNGLKSSFKEIRQIQKGEKEGTTLNDFLNEL